MLFSPFSQSCLCLWDRQALSGHRPESTADCFTHLGHERQRTGGMLGAISSACPHHLDPSLWRQQSQYMKSTNPGHQKSQLPTPSPFLIRCHSGPPWASASSSVRCTCFRELLSGVEGVMHVQDAVQCSLWQCPCLSRSETHLHDSLVCKPQLVLNSFQRCLKVLIHGIASHCPDGPRID
jgi:hypothetical protein